MAIKSQDQITIVDITDSYSVDLTGSAFTIPGDTSGHPTDTTTITVSVKAYRGTTPLTSDDVSIGSITTITGVSASTSGLVITLTVGTSCVGGQLSVPITVDGEIQFTKIISISIAKTGAGGSPGAKGDPGDPGADAILVTITSNNGTVFKNATGNTTLTAHVYKGGVEQTITDGGVVSGLGTIYWYKDGTKVTTPSKTLTIAASAVATKMVVSCQLEA